MGSLYYMVIVRYTHAMLPIIRVSIGQLIELTQWLIRYVEHARVMSYHLVLLESNRYKL